MKRAVVTGAGGYIGRQLCRYLAQWGVEVLAITRAATHALWLNYAGVTTLCVPDSLLKEATAACTTFCPDVLYHLAWGGVQTKYKNENTLQIANIELCLSAMELAEQSGCRRVVIPGSASEYAYCAEEITGRNVPAPGDFYAAAKAAAHILCQQYAQQHALSLNWLLVGSIYGPGRDGDNLITYTIKSLLMGEVPSFTKLEQKWDYLYISDLLQALYLVGECGIAGATYPVGFGKSEPLYWYVEKIRASIDPTLTLKIGALPYKNGRQPDHSVLDISALRADTGFAPQVLFEDGIANTIEYYRNRLLQK